MAFTPPTCFSPLALSYTEELLRGEWAERGKGEGKGPGEERADVKRAVPGAVSAEGKGLSGLVCSVLQLR